MSYSSVANSSHALHKKRKGCGHSCCRVLHPFCLTGHFSYAFIYGSWEVIRARKVGTTYTNVDYVVYRLFYPILLLGACLFGVVQEENLAKFFSLMEVWTMVLHISYAFIFLQNVLQNNLHRENVQHRQIIPERLIVTDEIERGGHKFYICKRSSILPTDKLYNREVFIYLLFNIVVTTDVCHLMAYAMGINIVSYAHNQNLESRRVIIFGGLALAEVFLTPIPMRMAHALYPLTYYGIYLCFSYIVYVKTGEVVYGHLKWGEVDVDTGMAKELTLRILGVAIIHFILVWLSVFRDYIISLLDNSRGGKQIHSLRAQKRLARRKIMNYIEGADGRIIGISLEKHLYTPMVHEVIQTEKLRRAHVQEEKVRHESFSEPEETTSTDDDEGSTTDDHEKIPILVDERYVVPINAKRKPQPEPRYKTRYLKNFRLSSSSSDEDFRKHREIDEIINIRFPSPPKSETVTTSQQQPRTGKYMPSKIPVLQTKARGLHARDSIENIHKKLDREETPPTPPFVQLVQDLVKIGKENRKAAEAEERIKRDKRNTNASLPAEFALVKVVRTVKEHEHEHLTDEEVRPPPLRKETNPPELMLEPKKKPRSLKRKKRPIQRNLVLPPPSNEVARLTINASVTGGGQGDRPRGSKIINVGSIEGGGGGGEANRKKSVVEEIKQQLNEIQRQSILPPPLEEPRKSEPRKSKYRPSRALSLTGEERAGKTERINKTIRTKGILKGQRRESLVRRREVKLFKRRQARIQEGKHGLPAYDPLTVPEIVNQETTFHYLGAKLNKGEGIADKHALAKDDLIVFQSHPGFSTIDNEDVEKERLSISGNPKNLVAFHPVVKYFDLNEKDKSKKNA